MQTRIKAVKVELSDKLKGYIQEKADMLDKYLGSVQVVSCDFEIGTVVGGQNSGDIYRAELNLSLPGQLLRVEKTEKDMFKAVDKVKDHMVRSIKKYKEKKMDQKRQPKDKGIEL